MNELIKTNTNESNEVVVSGRDLYDFLEVTERYNSWMERMIKYGFEVDEDFTSVKTFTVVNNGAGRVIDNHAIKLDMAKEISMLQRTDKGKEARKYFIEVEKEYKNNLVPTTFLEAMKLAVKLEEEKIVLQQEMKVKDQKLMEFEPKATYHDEVLNSPGLVTVTSIAKDYGMSGSAMNSTLNELGAQYKQGNIWLLYAKHQEFGYTKTHTYQNGRVSMKWTQKGRLFIYQLLKENGILPIIEKETA